MSEEEEITWVTEKEVGLDDIRVRGLGDSDAGDMVRDVPESLSLMEMVKIHEATGNVATVISTYDGEIRPISSGAKGSHNSSDDPSQFWKLFGCVGVCGYNAACVSVYVFTIKFLIDDEDKGGSCAQTSGKAIWVYVIANLCARCCSSNCQLLGEAAIEPRPDDTAGILVPLSCSFIINLGFCIYGSIVLFNDDVCDSYKRTGLYQMHIIMFWLNVAIIIFNLIPLIGQLLRLIRVPAMKAEMPRAEMLSGTDDKTPE